MRNLQKMRKIFIYLLIPIMFINHAQAYNAEREGSAEWQRVSRQLVTDLTAAGITLGAAMSGSVPLALAAGYITKYITTYGLAGIRSLIEVLKGYPPQDLGEINLSYIYLLHVKRNLYSTLIQIRKQAKAMERGEALARELDELSSLMVEFCNDEADLEKCKIGGPDQSLVNFTFLQIAMDARSNVDFDQFFSKAEVKNTYHYLMLLYLDVILVEQQLVQSQMNVLAHQITEVKRILSENPYLSQAEKEYQFQMGLNILLRWQKLMDQRRIGLHEALKKTLSDLEGEVDDLEDDIDDYEDRFKSFNKGANDSYNEQLGRLEEDMRESGLTVGALGKNPFQTGTTLQNFYLNEKTLLLERDTFFQMKANKLESTEHVADFQHRTRVLHIHANNILIQLSHAIKKRNEEGFINIEKPKHQQSLEAILKACQKDAACVAERLEKPETSVTNILIDNFALATHVFQQIPFMHAMEALSVYQLTQLIYGELLFAHNLLSKVEFSLFHEKQLTLAKKIAKNPNMSPSEKKLQRLILKKTINTWKKRILKRKYDSVDEFKKLATDMIVKNKNLYEELKHQRKNNKAAFGKLYDKGHCRSLLGFRKRRWCQGIKQVNEVLKEFKNDQYIFFNAPEMKLPSSFWKKI